MSVSWPDISRESSINRDDVYEVLSRKWVLASLTFLPAIILLAIIVYLPIIWGMLGSFNDISVYHPEWTFVGLDNYIKLVDDPRFISSLVTGTGFAVGSVALQVITGIALALILNKSFRYDNLVIAISFLPYLLPTAILMIIFKTMVGSNYGVINHVLYDLWIISEFIPFLGHDLYALPTAVVLGSWKFSIFVTILVLSKLQSIPDDLYEAAKMMGASSFQQFRTITLPNLKGVLFIAILMRSIWMFNKFDVIHVLTGGGPGTATETAPIYIYFIAFGQGQLGLALAGATILFVILAGAAIIYFKKFEPSQAVEVE